MNLALPHTSAYQNPLYVAGSMHVMFTGPTTFVALTVVDALGISNFTTPALGTSDFQTPALGVSEFTTPDSGETDL